MAVLSRTGEGPGGVNAVPGATRVAIRKAPPTGVTPVIPAAGAAVATAERPIRKDATASMMGTSAGSNQSANPEPSGEEFSAAVTAATSMFGDPTRRRMYLFARESEKGATASEAAEWCEVHPNVARHHLDRLAAGGYLEVVAEPQLGKSGRPSKRYRSTGKPIDLEFPARRHDLIVSLLSRALELLPPDVASVMAEEVGEHYGRELAMQMNPGDSHRSKAAALHAVADALTAHGFAAHTEAREGSMAIVRDHCPFGDLSASHPVICAVDRGMVRGMLHELYGNAESSLTESRPQGDTVCVTTV